MFGKATDNQLKTLAKDKNFPSGKIKELVLEMFDRHLFDGFLEYLLEGRFKNYAKVFYSNGITKNDLKQIAFVGIWKAVNTFESGKSSFIHHATFSIRGEWHREMSKINAQKRKDVRYLLSTDESYGGRDEIITLLSFISNDVNVERTVIRKLHLEWQLGKLNERERYTIIQRLQGKTNVTISNELNLSHETINISFRRALVKMNIKNFTLQPKRKKKARVTT